MYEHRLSDALVPPHVLDLTSHREAEECADCATIRSGPLMVPTRSISALRDQHEVTSGANAQIGQ